MFEERLKLGLRRSDRDVVFPKIVSLKCVEIVPSVGRDRLREPQGRPVHVQCRRLSPVTRGDSHRLRQAILRFMVNSGDLQDLLLPTRTGQQRVEEDRGSDCLPS